MYMEKKNYLLTSVMFIWYEDWLNFGLRLSTSVTLIMNSAVAFLSG